MQKIDRRKFLGVAGAHGAAAAVAVTHAGSLLGRGVTNTTQAGTVTFHAEKVMPDEPLPQWGTAVVDGTVNLATGTGMVTARIMAGHLNSGIALPRVSRMVKVNKASVVGNQVRMDGVVEDRSQLARGESAAVHMVLDRGTKQLHTEIDGYPVTLAVS